MKKILKGFVNSANRTAQSIVNIKKAYNQAMKEWRASPAHARGVQKVKEQQYGGSGKSR